MTLRRYLLLMAFATAICWATWISALFNTNPFEASLVSFIVFYLSLFLALLGTLAIASLAMRIWVFKQNDPHFRQVKKSFRQGILLSVLFVIAVILQSQRLLNWLNTLLLIFAFTFFELFFIAGDHRETKG